MTGTNALTGSMNYGPGSHAGTISGSARWGWRMYCDCGERSFPATATADGWESPQWEAHVRRERASAPTTTVPNQRGLE